MEFEPRTLVNGSILKQNSGQLVSIMVCVDDITGTTLNATTTDNQKVRVSLPMELNARKGAWVEVIGTPNGADSVRGKEIIEFGGENVDFDTDGYNGMINVINNIKSLYRYG